MPKIKRTAVEVQDELDVLHMTGFDADKQEAARAALRTHLAGELNDRDKPYCTCATAGGFMFDQQMGLYVHISGKAGVFCYKPSKRYWEVASRAGIIRP